MGIISTVLLVFFVIIAILLVLLVLVQTDEGGGLGVFAGGSSSAFGSRAGNILTKTTSVLGAAFLIMSLGLALLNRTPGGTGVLDAGLDLMGEQQFDWLEGELNPPGEAVPEPYGEEAE